MADGAVIDLALVDRWARGFVTGDLQEIRGVFETHGARGPQIVWHPSIDLLEASPLRFLLAYWSRIAGTNSIPRTRDIDAIAMRAALGYIALLDVQDGGADFRYRVFGTAIAAVSDFDMTGRLLSDLPASLYIVEFALAAYRAVVMRRAPLFTEHTPAGTVVVKTWQRIIMPLVDDEGAVVRLLSCNVPIPRDGQVLAPRL